MTSCTTCSMVVHTGMASSSHALGPASDGRSPQPNMGEGDFTLPLSFTNVPQRPHRTACLWPLLRTLLHLWPYFFVHDRIQNKNCSLFKTLIPVFV